MAKKRALEGSTKSLAATLTGIRARSSLSQAEVARRMHTSQAAIARLESGRQSPSVGTLQDFARANGFCLEINFVPVQEDRSGCILVVYSNG